MQEASRGGVHILNAGYRAPQRGSVPEMRQGNGASAGRRVPQADGYSEEDFENAYDSMFDENGNPDPELLKNIGFEDITNGFKPHDSDTDDDDSEDDVDDSDDPDKKDELFQKGGANTMPEFFKKMFEPFEGALSKDDMDKLNEEAKAKSPKKKQEKTDKKRRTLETFCTNLTRRSVARKGRQNRPHYRQGQGDRQSNPDTFPQDEEQSLPYRRTRRRKDRHCRGYRAEACKRGRSVQAPGQGALPARPYRACSAA